MKQINSKNIIDDVAKSEFIATILQIALLFFALSIVLMITLYIHNKLKENKIAKTAQLSRILQDILFRYLHLNWNEDDKKSQITNKLLYFSTNEFYRKTLVNYIIQLLKLFQGEEKEKLQSLYKDLGFQHDMLLQLKSKSWLKRLNAINELCNMELIEYRNQIFQLLNDKNHEVKLVAMQAIILIDKHPFNFLLNTTLILTQSQILYITKKATEIKLENKYDILKLSQSNEDSHVLLSLHLAELYECKNLLEHFIPFLNHSNVSIKSQTFILLAQLDEQKYHTILSTYCQFTSHEEITMLLNKVHSRYLSIPSNANQLIINALNHQESAHSINYHSVFYDNLFSFC